MKTIHFRPHHFLCTLGFIGKGYSPAFVKNYQAIVQQLNDPSQQITIEVTPKLDSICAPCPNHTQGVCQTENIIHALDTNHAEILELKPGDQLTWPEAKERIRTHMTLEKFHHACALCSWKKLGICEEKLRELLSS